MPNISVAQLAFSRIKGITIDLANTILGVVGSEENFFRMSETELSALAEAKNKVFSASYRESLLNDAERELEFVLKNNIRCLYFRNSDYPARFMPVPDAPLLLYVKGDVDFNSKKIISVVGTRRETVGGRKLTQDLVRDLGEIAGQDVIVTSGLAYGVDVTAHLAALDAGLTTIAVVAHGLDMIYPAQHRSVAIEIIRKDGALATEYASKTRIHRSNFLARNRLIAALADCTIVVESAVKGGALVTAKIAQSYGRDVFAFPGRVGDEFSVGCNNLIKNNVAALVANAEDVIDFMGWKRVAKPIEKSLFVEYTSDEQAVLNCLSGDKTIQINQLSTLLKTPVHKLHSTLFELEFKGAIVVLPGNNYRLS